jgi:phospholipid/cholesterol/gamma-HCH transport system substrate-binding protein
MRLSRYIDGESLAALLKLSVFLIITGGCTFILMLILGNGSFADRNEYKAVFEDVTGVAKGDDVRIAGVAVGSVSKVEIVDRNKALVTFGVDADTPLTQNTNVTIKFRNLVGQRYFALTQGAEGATSLLKPGSTIPEDRTQEALDLNVLLDGFKPVFQALSPGDLNKFAFEIVQTLQGESGNVENLLARTSSLTNTLADRDQLIGDVITNLSTVLQTIGDRDDELTDTIGTLQQFVTGLKTDRNAILDSIDSISELSDETSDLLVKGRPALTEDIKQLNAFAGGLSKKQNLKLISDSIQVFPKKLEKFGNAASSGSEFNFYLCSLTGTIDLSTLGVDAPLALEIPQEALGGARCEP